MTRNAILYQAFGIDFQSALALPELRAGSGSESGCVKITLGPAPCPDDARLIETGVAAGPHVFWMEVPGIVRLCVRNGREIAVDIADGATESTARAFLLGSALGALLHQRGLLPIHASAVVISGRAVAFAGHSGAGKSTMALHMTRRGHRLLCDDIWAIDTSGPVPVVWPGLSSVKLWRETLATVGQSPEGLEQVLPSLDKYRLPIDALAGYRPYPLGAIFSLRHSDDQSAPAVERMGGADAAGVLVANTFRGQLVKPMGRSRAHFDQCMAIARHSGVQRLTRPWAIDQLETSCALVERTAILTT